MIIGIQIIGILFALFMIYYTFLHYKRKEFTVKESGFWLILWVLFLGVTIMPRVLDPIIHTLKIARKLDFLIIVGFMFILGAVVYTYGVVRGNQKRTDDIVRKITFMLEEKENREK